MHNPTYPKQVILIPYWLKNTLSRQNLPPTAMLDLAQLSKISSNEDLVLTMELNALTAPVYGTQYDAGSLEQAWLKTQEDRHTYTKLSQLKLLHTQGLQERLFNAQTLQEDYPDPYDIIDLNRSFFLVTVYPGHFGGPQAAVHQDSLVRALLKLFYAHTSYSEMAKNPLFASYLAKL
jgi:hypothetical protein